MNLEQCISVRKLCLQRIQRYCILGKQAFFYTCFNESLFIQIFLCGLSFKFMRIKRMEKRSVVIIVTSALSDFIRHIQGVRCHYIFGCLCAQLYFIEIDIILRLTGPNF